MRLHSTSLSKTEQNRLLPPASSCSFHWQEEAGTEKWLQSVLTALHILSSTKTWSVRILQSWESVFSCSTEWHRESLSRKEVWPCWHSGRCHCSSRFSTRMWCHHYWWCCTCTLSLAKDIKNIWGIWCPWCGAKDLELLIEVWANRHCVWCLQDFKPQNWNEIKERQRKSA